MVLPPEHGAGFILAVILAEWVDALFGIEQPVAA
jgi:hypothetical protein